MNTRRVRRPSGAMIVALAALFVALSDSGTAATFQNFLLGKTNRPTRPTGIAASLRGPVFALANTGAGVSASFNVKAGAQPFTVNSATKVQKLNADLLDGKDSTSFWSLTGNSGTNPAANFLGTTDAQPLVVQTNNQEAFRVTPTGTIGVGTATPSGKVGVVASGSTDAIVATTASGDAMDASSTAGIGVNGASSGNRGVEGVSQTDIGVEGISDTGEGMVGTLGRYGCPENFPESFGAGGCGASAGAGVLGVSTSHEGVYGSSTTGAGVFGESTGIGVYGDSTSRGIVGTLAHASCAGSYAIGGCGGDHPGVLGASRTEAVVGQLLGNACPALTAAVLGCAGNTGDGIVGVIAHPVGGGGAAAVHAINNDGGDLFIGDSEGVRKVRIDGAGTGYFDGGTQNGGADYADSMRADSASKLRPGDVLAIDPAKRNTVSLASSANSTLVAGVYSTKPAVLGVGNHQIGASLAGQVPVALVGVVPTKVSAENGPVHVGDLLTTSSTPGYAMKAKPVLVNGVAVYPTGTILGKAMQPLASGKGLIKVLVTLR